MPQMMRALFETAPDAMIVADVRGTVVLANPQASTLFGYPHGELTGLPIEALMPREVRDAHRVHRDRYMNTPRVRPMGAGQELIGERRDGTRFPVEIALSPIETDEGRFFVASIRDISATQRARQALARAHYDKYVAQAGQLALEAPVDTTLDRLPAMLAEALGVDAVAVVFGSGPRAALQARAAHGVAAHEIGAVLDALGDAAPVAGNADAQALRFDAGRAQPFQGGAAARLFDVDQPMGALVALSREPREFEREALHFMQSVANVLASVLQRTRAQEQLAHAQRLEAVGQLTGGIAHDFNNLLTVISGNLQLLEAELGDRGDVQELIGSALRAVGRGAELTRKLLAFARRQRLSPRALAPAQLLGELGLMLRRTLGEQVDLEIDVGTGAPDVWADHAQLEAALINLALNARDAMPRGGRLRIGVRGETVGPDDAGGDAKPGDYVVFEVGDTGLGMTPEVLARAFEPFFTTKEQGKGSGLGLSMVYGFVKQSGGFLRTDSRLGFGTRIELCLPAAPRAARPSADAAEGAPSRGRETILVVEDEPDVRGIATAFLRSLGYTVHAARDAAEARERLAAHPEVTLLFSDVVLGSGPTGAELARDALRERPGLKVLLTSGYERPSAESEEQPGTEFELLRKPYRREELAAAVRKVIDGA